MEIAALAMISTVVISEFEQQMKDVIFANINQN
jgi:hypothetical protein